MKEEYQLELRLLQHIRSQGYQAWNVNAGSFKHWKTGKTTYSNLPKGMTDIIGHKDGRMFFIEIKTPKGLLERSQKDFIESMIESGALAGVATNEDEVDNILSGGLGNTEKMLCYRGYLKDLDEMDD